MKSPLKDKYGRNLSVAKAAPKVKNRLAAYWLELRTALIWWLSFLPSHGLRRFFVRLSGVRIGAASYIHSGLRLYDPSRVHIGTGTIIGYNATLDGRDDLRIGDHVDIASDVMIYNGQHDVHSAGFDPVFKPVTIENYCFIGPRAIIMPGITLNEGAVVAAGAVVTKDVAPHTIVGGIPASKIGERQPKELHYLLGRPRLFQ
jgi:acetyltransferase-like isoleucine patch superfamily enzyme